jgi:LDH2 family malate/lactate/ureidoglycolate dehydrogenase
VDRVTLPGDPERRLMVERLRTGLSFDDANWNPLVKLAGECGVALPG